eukprot:COSAG01_NODE_3950_length_5502_cov_2.057561_2_plen_691_part_01
MNGKPPDRSQIGKPHDTKDASRYGEWRSNVLLTDISDAVQRVTKNDPNIVEATWLRGYADDEELETLGRALQANSHIRTIEIGDGKTSDAGAKAILAAISGSIVTSVESVRWRGATKASKRLRKQIFDECLPRLVARIAANAPDLQYVAWDHSGVDDIGLKKLAEALLDNNFVRSIDLSYNESITGDGIAHLQAVLPHCKVEAIILTGLDDSISIDAIKSLTRVNGRENLHASISANDPQLIAVELISTDQMILNDDAISLLAACLQQNSHVRTLKFVGKMQSQVTDQGAATLLKAISNSHSAVESVRWVRMPGQPSDDLRQQLFQACLPRLESRIAANASDLTRVDWSGNCGADDTAAERLAAALQSNQTVKIVDLDENTRISRSGLAVLNAVRSQCAVNVLLAPSGDRLSDPPSAYGQAQARAPALAPAPYGQASTPALPKEAGALASTGRPLGVHWASTGRPLGVLGHAARLDTPHVQASTGRPWASTAWVAVPPRMCHFCLVKTIADDDEYYCSEKCNHAARTVGWSDGRPSDAPAGHMPWQVPAQAPAPYAYATAPAPYAYATAPDHSHQAGYPPRSTPAKPHIGQDLIEVTGGKADQIKTQIVDKSLHAEAPVSVAAAYECPATSFVRAGFEMDSEKTGIVKRGPAAALPVAAPSSGGAFPPIVAYQGKGIQIRFDFAKAPSNES